MELSDQTWTNLNFKRLNNGEKHGSSEDIYVVQDQGDLVMKNGNSWGFKQKQWVILMGCE